MLIKDIFEKPISRDIDGVIKANDERNLETEITEYVLTEQIQNCLQDFFDYYNQPGSVNGAWISGFFGSGKSHLLKMLTYLLNNYVVDNKTVLDYFLPQCKDSFLTGALRKACSFKSINILFNIDQQADAITNSREENSPMLNVFLKVFNNACGYYGKLPHVAEFERKLDQEGNYDLFKQTYKEIANQDWSMGRTQTQFKTDSIKQAYERIYNTTLEENFFQKYREDCRFSIEDFAVMVKQFLDKQGPGSRINFLVDEVGQFIGQKSQLMVNLQTIAESLQTECQGRAWVIVTAQEDMDSTIGELSCHQQYDFSKIQDRLKARIKLTSQDVSEVIERRLLQKKGGDVQTRLAELYNNQEASFQTLFNFEGCYNYPVNYADEQEFINYYPFLPYQINMFSDSIVELSQCRVFEGRHSSVGERSMLGVFQAVGKELETQNCEIGSLASFDMLYAGIDKTVKSLAKKTIDNAERDWRNQNKDFEIRLLKALFLVKYIDKKFRATADNLSVLMRSSFDQKPHELLEKTKDALAWLENNICIKKNDDVYTYLTNEERDIEEQIKNQSIENNAIIELMHDVIFGEILGNKTKIRYEKNKQDFEFGKRIDQNAIGREKRLWIHFISPLASRDCLSSWLGVASQHNEIIFVLEPVNSLSDDIRKYLKATSFCEARLNSGVSDSQRKILESKVRENNKLKTSIVAQIRERIGAAKVYVKSDPKIFTMTDPKNRVEAAFQTLVQVVYPNLKMVENGVWNEQEVGRVLDEDENVLIEKPLSEPENCVLNYIANLVGEANTVTLKSVVDHFSNDKFGWSFWVSVVIVAKLVKRGLMDVRCDAAAFVEKDKLKSVLVNTRVFDQLRLFPLKPIPPKVLNAVKAFYHDLSSLSVPANDMKSIGNALQDLFKEQQRKMKQALEHKNEFPFLRDLNRPLELISYWCNCFVREFFDKMTDAQRQEIRDVKETVIDRILEFMESDARKTLYRKARQVLDAAQVNRDELAPELFTNIEDILNDPKCYASPAFTNLNSLILNLTQENSRKQTEAKNTADRKVLVWKQYLLDNAYFKALSSDRQDYYLELFDSNAQRLHNKQNIAAINDFVNRFENCSFNPIVQSIYQELHPKTEVKWVNLKDVKSNFDKQHLESDADVDQYTQALNAALKRELNEGRLVQL